MIVELRRTSVKDEATLGSIRINGDVICETLEDLERDEKIFSKTAIPVGMYPLRLRQYGRFNEIYKKRYGDKHYGMIEIMNVKDYTDVLIHCGNTIADTAGCVLVGSVHKGAFLENSRLAYEKLYPLIAEKLKKGEKVYLEITSEVKGV